ncbi:cupin domain-containing protein [Parahaliea maris]|nr:cupin domain-containing protein [Parahaliea maris]
MRIDELPAHSDIWESDSDNPLGFLPRPDSLGSLDFLSGGVKVMSLNLPTDADMVEYLKDGIPGHDEHGFHRTPTLDILILLEGELSLELDDGLTSMKPGDVVVQRNTNHAWRNTGDKPARCFSVICSPVNGLNTER